MHLIHLIQFFIFSICIHLFTIFIYLSYYSDYFLTQNIAKKPHKYDYIVVGSGTAGSLIAHRIATETNYTVIVLEAGSNSNSLLDIPVLGPLLIGSVYSWLYKTVPQKYACLGMNNKICSQHQGKIVGGSSKLNNMVHFRGNIKDYMKWFNNKYDEHVFINNFEEIENKYLHLNELQYDSELGDAILDAALEIGYQRMTGDFGIGFKKSKLSQKNGKRWSTSDNLDITNYVVTNALVEKVIIKDNIAHGVKFSLGNLKYTFHAKRGVILSAGSYNTPKILQLSGVGPKSLLKQFDIPVIKDLPVGQNLQDHVTTGLDLITFKKPLSVTPLHLLNPKNVFDYIFNGTGPFTSPGCEVIGFISTKNETTPDLQFMVLPVGITSDRGSNLRKVLGVSDYLWHNYFVKSFNKHTGTILPILLHPRSKGFVAIKSKDPEEPPLIDPKYLSSQVDVDVLVRGLEIMYQLVNTVAMRKVGVHVNKIKLPGCEHYDFFSPPYLECYVRHLTLTSYHPVGTCSMGLPTSKHSVVDTSFKVLGLEHLYVADGSVLPSLPGGNVNAAILLMANIFVATNIVPDVCENICHKHTLHKFLSSMYFCKI